MIWANWFRTKSLFLVGFGWVEVDRFSWDLGGPVTISPGSLGSSRCLAAVDSEFLELLRETANSHFEEDVVGFPFFPSNKVSQLNRQIN